MTEASGKVKISGDGEGAVALGDGLCFGVVADMPQGDAAPFFGSIDAREKGAGVRIIEASHREAELAELRRWKLRPGGTPGLFARLVDHEFQTEEEQQARQNRALGKLLQFAAARVPHYRDLFLRLGIGPDEIRGGEDLPLLPILTKRDLIDRVKELRAEGLPPGEGPPVAYESTGTTGQAVKVVMSRSSSAMFSFLWHRQARWFRLDPTGSFVKVRIPSTLPRQKDGSPMPRGKVMLRDAWMYLGAYFQTGPEVTYSISNPMEQQIAWLKRFRPNYMLAYPGVFEELGLACEGASPVDSLKGLLGIGSSAPASMRAWIERTYDVPLHQNYGLNEVGMVAIRCAAGRYHVNNEHCLVEIVDAEGRACPAGGSGRLLVTALQNIAMPLIRYDTGDIAQAVDGACPCGRTLPAFEDIVGRYRRYAGLPPGTRERVRALLEAFEEMPPEVVRNLRRYQIYQDAEDRFEVRVSVVGPLPPEFEARIRARWVKVCGDRPLPLEIIAGATIVSSPGGKLLDFDSAFYSKADLAARAAIEDRS